MSNLVQQYVPIAIVLLVALTFHEFAHAWVAYRLGDNTAQREGRVTLNPIVHLDLMGTLCFLMTGMFGWAKPVPVNPTNFAHPRRDDFLVTAAGPASNLVIAVISGLLLRLLYAQGIFTGTLSPTLTLLHVVLIIMVQANLYLAFFNLIPLFPLDGSHMVNSMLPLNQAYEFKKFNDQYGPWLLLGLILAGPLTGHKLDPLGWILHPPVSYLSKLLIYGTF